MNLENELKVLVNQIDKVITFHDAIEDDTERENAAIAIEKAIETYAPYRSQSRGYDELIKRYQKETGKEY